MGNVELSPQVKTLQLGRMKNQSPTNLNSMTLHKHRRMFYTLACSGICDTRSFQNHRLKKESLYVGELLGRYFLNNQ